jgi:hypothetical protein
MRQIEELSMLFERAGFTSFREARHPYGLTQRQAGGKFTVDEANELIDRLTAAEAVQQVGTGGRTGSVPGSDDVFSGLTDESIAAELERRGWCCIPPLRETST